MDGAEIIAVADSVAIRLAPLASDAWAMARQRVVAVAVMSLIGEVTAFIVAAFLMRWSIKTLRAEDTGYPAFQFAIAGAACSALVLVICFCATLCDVTSLLSLDYATATKMIDLVRPGAR